VDARDDRPVVFCSECTWYREQRVYRRPSHTFVRTEQTCLHPRALYATAVRLARHTPGERNALNDCPDFQPAQRWVLLWRTHGTPLSLMLGLWAILALLLYWSRYLR